MVNMINLDQLLTEMRNQLSMNIDQMAISEAINLMCEEDQKAVKIVQGQVVEMTQAVELMVTALRNGGRIFYSGSGTSGRLGVLDAAELLPTFGVGEDSFKAIIAGGETAMFHPVESAEDNRQAGVSDLQVENPSAGDVLIGISASGRTSYVLGALEEARRLELKTISLTCNAKTPMAEMSDVTIAPIVGPEVITGSTRLKAGTAQKLVLNILSTVTMIQLGKVYKNLMVDMLPTNEKLQYRSRQIVMDATGVSAQVAGVALGKAKGNMKVAIVMLEANCDLKQATQLLLDSEGFVTKALALAKIK